MPSRALVASGTSSVFVQFVQTFQAVPIGYPHRQNLTRDILLQVLAASRLRRQFHIVSASHRASPAFQHHELPSQSEGFERWSRKAIFIGFDTQKGNMASGVICLCSTEQCQKAAMMATKRPFSGRPRSHLRNRASLPPDVL